MATSYYAPTMYGPLSTPTTPVGTAGNFQNSTDPRKIAANQRELAAQQGDVYQANDENLANQYLAQQAGTQGYLNPIEQTLASGGGGYNPSEVSSIELSPTDKQNIITGAGISAGAGTASAVGAAERAAAAAGGNPTALATYRARAAQTEGANAGDAMTQARSTAKQLESQGAQTVGNARMNQQQQGLQYLGGLQQEQGQQGLSEQGLGQQAYGTSTQGTTAAADLGLRASQTPSSFDKIAGGLSGAAAAFLADGASPYLADGDEEEDRGIDAVLGEDGPEVIVEAASDPVRSHTKFMADGSYPDYRPYVSYLPDSYNGTSIEDILNGPQPEAPPLSAGVGPTTGEQMVAADSAANPDSGQKQSWFQRFRQNLSNSQRPASQGYGQPVKPWSPSDTYGSIGTAAGELGRAIFLADGYGPDAPGTPQPPKLVTKPTMVHLEKSDMVVPLSYRPKAKVRPSAALPAMQRYGVTRAA